MNTRCNCYNTKTERLYSCDPVTGQVTWHDLEVGICFGTKERDICICEGNRMMCDFYPGLREKAKRNITLTDAINHFKHGISHDIFSEPVTSYAKMAVEAMEKQIPMKPLEVGKYGFGCPNCKTDCGIEKEDIYIYDMEPPKYCENCGQKLDWKEYK